jgi:hypothetical protein
MGPRLGTATNGIAIAADAETTLPALIGYLPGASVGAALVDVISQGR